MSNAKAIADKMSGIIKDIDDGKAASKLCIRALAKGIELLAKDIVALEYREQCKFNRENVQSKADPFGIDGLMKGFK